MQARQFSAAGIRNFLDVVKAGQLNDGVAACNRIQSGLASGDYCMLSLVQRSVRRRRSHDHPVSRRTSRQEPVRCTSGTRTGRMTPTPATTTRTTTRSSSPARPRGATTRTPGASTATATPTTASKNGWFFAIPTSLEIHKGKQPISAGFVLTQASLLFVKGTGAAVTQIEDANGRRLFRTDRARPNRGDLETDPDRRLTGVAPWPWDAATGGSTPGDLFFINRPPGSPPLTVTVRGPEYSLTHASTSHLTELTAASSAPGKDRITLEGSDADAQVLEVRTDATNRHIDIHHLRAEPGGDWRSVAVRNAKVTRDGLRVHAPLSLEGVEVSGATTRRDVDVEFQRYTGNKLTRRKAVGQRVPAGKALQLAPSDWDRLSRAKIDQIVT